MKDFAKLIAAAIVLLIVGVFVTVALLFTGVARHANAAGHVAAGPYALHGGHPHH
jgi:hypothetical protein